MQLKRLLNDDDAVSPVIGVILMVAITVILAAVIATFVLGLGEQISDSAPNASFSFDYEADSAGNQGDSWSQSSGDAILTITHSGGPNIDAAQLGATGSSQNSSLGAGDSYDDFSTATSISWSKMSAGDSISIRMDSGDRINIVWENDEGSESSILQQFNGPDA